MRNESRTLEEDNALELMPEFSYESRHEFVQRLAYKLWSQRGQPIGSPEVDWFAAEQALYASLVASGTINPLPDGSLNMRKELYR